MRKQTAFRRRLVSFIESRQSLGLTVRPNQRTLEGFVHHMEQHGERVITSRTALQYVRKPGVSLAVQALRLSHIRGFARYCALHDARHEVPPRGVIRAIDTRAEPYIYSEKEIESLIAAARTFPSKNGLFGDTYATLIGILSCTGIRIGEAIALRCEDVDLQAGVMVIRSSKRRIARKVRLHPSTLKAMTCYAKRRNQCHPIPRTDRFFVSYRGYRLRYPIVCVTFHRICALAGIDRGTERRRPRLHDLRHTFVCRSIAQWQAERRDDVPQLMMALSAYLGHSHPRYTYWYVTAIPELLAACGQRFHLFVNASKQEGQT